jgi:ABC-type phosphate transport system permease subunit
MSTNKAIDPATEKSRKKWPLKTLIEILPIIIALTAIFSYSTIKNVSRVKLVTPLAEVLGGVPIWVAGLMGLVALVGLLGMTWLIFIFTRAPLAADGRDEEE